MLTPEQINNIHRLRCVEKQSVRKIARQLHLGRRTIAKYLITPGPPLSIGTQQAGPLQARHRRTARTGFHRQRGSDRATTLSINTSVQPTFSNVEKSRNPFPGTMRS